MPIAVLDNTVFVSMALRRGSGALKVRTAWHDELFELITSEAILFETDRVLTAQKLPQEDITELLTTLRTSATLVTNYEPITACRDADDNKILEAAVAGEADYIVSDDKDLRVLSPFRGIEIVTVNRFLRRIGIPRSRRKRSANHN